MAIPPPSIKMAPLIDDDIPLDILRGLRVEPHNLHVRLTHAQAGETSINANSAYITQTINDLTALTNDATNDNTIRHMNISRH